MYIPSDPDMLFSIINMKLRDVYNSLDALCEDEDVERIEIEEKLNAAGYFYNEKNNQFK